MTFLEKITIFFEYFMDILNFKTCKMLKTEFNKQIIDRCDSKIDFLDYIQSIIEKHDNLCYIKNIKETECR